MPTNLRNGNTRNKFRGSTSDATTSLALIVPLIIMSFGDFNPQNWPYSSFENNTGHTDGPTDTTSYRDA